MLPTVVSAALLFSILAPAVVSQECYNQPGCIGEIVPVDTQSARGCCAGTNDGMSYGTSGNCIITQCIVHGFDRASYNVTEEERLDFEFRFNVKGNSTNTAVLILSGTITAQPAGTASTRDFEALRARVSENPFRLFTINDEVTLEYDDAVLLSYQSDIPDLVNQVEVNFQEFIRESAIVRITDNDQLQINFEEADLSIGEGDGNTLNIRIQHRQTQNPFVLILTPVSIDRAEETFNVSNFIQTGNIAPTARATSGLDFTNMTFNVTVPATGSGSFVIPQNFTVIDDDIDEIEQSFALVAELDVPPEFACFQTQVGEADCFGSKGAIEIKIVDNDAMVIGFSQRRVTVSEESLFSVINVTSERTSEQTYDVVFRVQNIGDAKVVDQINAFSDTDFDAQFGIRTAINDPIEDSRRLLPGNVELESPPPLIVTIVNDFRPEDEECFTISIISVDQESLRENFDCNSDDLVPPPTDFFCQHTICIDDDDEPFRVAFVETMYTVVESRGPVEVCVNLTSPQIDILDEEVRVSVTDFEESVYIPNNTYLATPDNPDFLRRYLMPEGTDFQAQVSFFNLISATRITQLSRIVCYDQVIYDDERLEKFEYAGLLLGVFDVGQGSTVQAVVEPGFGNAAIQIIDDDVAMVGLEMTTYRVSEDVGILRVCAVVYSPNITCPIEFAFNLSLSTLTSGMVSSGFGSDSGSGSAGGGLLTPSTAFDAADSPSDFVAQQRTLVEFAQCETESCVEIEIVDDLVLEMEEIFSLVLNRTLDLDTRITISPDVAVVTIVDNDDAVVGLERTVYTVAESVGVVQLCAIVYRPNIVCPITFPFIVQLSTRDGTAVQPMDYTDLINVPLMFDSCELRSCADVIIVNDLLLEETESFFADLSPSNGFDSRISLNPVVAEITITDEDVAVVGLERTYYNVTEDVGRIEVCAVVRQPTGSCPINFPFTVLLSTIDDTAVSVMDYTQLINEPLEFAACETRQCTDVFINNDLVPEMLESFFVNLTRSPGLTDVITLDPTQAEIEIIDASSAVVGLESTAYVVNEDSGYAEICAVVYEPSSAIACPVDFSFEVTLTTISGSAMSEDDFLSVVLGSLPFAACQRHSCLNVTIVDDLILELTERFTITLEPSIDLDSRITLDPVDGYVEIIDNDVAVVGLELTEYSTGEGDGQVEICTIVYVPAGEQCPIQFQFDIVFSTDDGTAESPTDYLGTSEVLTFPSCSQRQCVNVTIQDDESLELTEFFYANISRSFELDARIDLNPINAVVNILDNDVGVVGLVNTIYRVTETVGVLEVCARVFQPQDPQCPISFSFDVQLSTSDNTAVAPDDYIGLVSVLTYEACQVEECRTITIIDDNTAENIETFYVNLTESIGGLDSRITLDPVDAVVEIIDSSMAVVGLERTVYSVSEGVIAVEVCAVVFSPNNSCPINFAFEVGIATNNGTAVYPEDYIEQDTVLVFPECERRSCIDIEIVNDEMLEEEEFLSVTLTRTPGLDARITLSPVAAEITVIDDDVAVVGLERTVYSVGEDEVSVELCVIVYQPSGISCPIDFNFDLSLSTTDHTAMSTVDYRGVSTIVTFSACETRQCRTVMIFDDQVLEDLESFNVTVSRTVNLDSRITINPSDGQVLIFDDDTAVVGLEETFYMVPESIVTVEVCAVVFEPPSTVLPCAIPFPFELAFSTIPGTAVAPMDYGELVTTLQFDQCSRRACAMVTIVDDFVDEPDESFNVTLERAVTLDDRISIIRTTGEIVITDNDIPITVGYEKTVYTISETAGYVQLCIILFEPSTGQSPRPFELTVTTTNGTAEPTVDYVPLDGLLLRFRTGDSRVCHNITIIQDLLCEDTPEDLFSDLTLFSGDQPINISNPMATIVIDDSSEPECNDIVVGYERTDYTVTETDGYIELCVVITEPSTGLAPRPFQLSVSTSNGTAGAPQDYEEITDLVFDYDIGTGRLCHNITINQDDLCEEPFETIFSNLELISGIEPIVVINTPAIITIIDTEEIECNEIIVGYQFSVYSTDETTGIVDLCVAITEPSSGGAPREFVLTSTTRNGSAGAGVDYVGGSYQLIFPVGTEIVCHSVSILDDTDCEPEPEDFFADLTLSSGELVTISRPQTQVVITDGDGNDCDIVVGYERTFYSVDEGNVVIELCVIVTTPASGGAPRNFTLSYNTTDYTADAPEDYISTQGILTFTIGSTEQCYNVQIVDDEFCDPGLFLSSLTLESGEPVITVTPDTARINIFDPDCDGLVNDTLTGDPLMTVPIRTDMATNDTISTDSVPSLCYEVHGKADTYFNLISDTCTSVNAYYQKLNTSSDNIDLNMVTKIGVRAVEENTNECVNIQVDLDGCTTYVDGELVSATYSANGIRVRRNTNTNKPRVRISVPNCAVNGSQLVMWVFCASGQVEDPVTWEIFNASFIRFVVMRGLNLNDFSHGIIGQFWNVPVEVEEFTGLFVNESLPNDYIITVRYPGREPRQFVGIESSMTWEMEKRPCYFVGNGQGGKLSSEEIAPPNPNDPVIEGHYSDYIVESLFATGWKYSHFDEDECNSAV